MSIFGFSWTSFVAVLTKEFVQMRRDRLTLAMLIGIPVMQLILFGYAINMDPKNMPTAVFSADRSEFSRAFVAGLQNTGYFDITHAPESEAEAEALMKKGLVQFVIQIPPNFSRDFQRGEQPEILIIADGSDPSANSNAIAALAGFGDSAFSRQLTGSLAYLAPGPDPYRVTVHTRYNPERVTQYNIVPGLLGVILTLTLVLITSLAITRETERGTMEALLAMPVRPLEVLAGKIVPYIVAGYVQVTVILVSAYYLFDVPMVGSMVLLSALLVIFIAANLAIGFTFSTVAQNQLQAMQMSLFFFLPSILLSGFMFPFRGMPNWAQWIGEVLPLTHFLRIVRGIMLKGSGITDIGHEVWPLLAFLAAAVTLALVRYRDTLD